MLSTHTGTTELSSAISQFFLKVCRDEGQSFGEHGDGECLCLVPQHHIHRHKHRHQLLEYAHIHHARHVTQIHNHCLLCLNAVILCFPQSQLVRDILRDDWDAVPHRLVCVHGQKVDDLRRVDAHTEGPLLGLFGPAKVNVLKLNVALDELKK